MQIIAKISNFLHWLTKPMPKVDEYKLPLKPLNRFTQAFYDRYLRKVAEMSVLLGYAKPEEDFEPQYLTDKAIRGYHIDIVKKKGSLNNDPLDQEAPQKPIKVRPWPMKKLLQIIKMLGLQVAKSMDAIIVSAAKPQGEAITFRRTITPGHLVEAVVSAGDPFRDHQRWDGEEEDYLYYICACTEDRLAFLREQDGWWFRSEYAAYVNRERHETEIGRYELGYKMEDTETGTMHRAYVVFVKIEDEDSKQMLLIGAETHIAVTPLKNNLRTVFTDVPSNGKPVEGVSIHWRMKFAAEITGKYQVLVAKKGAR